MRAHAVQLSRVDDATRRNREARSRRRPTQSIAESCASFPLAVSLLLRRRRWRLLLIRLLVRRLLLAAAATCAAIGHGHDIGAVLERLVETTDVASHILVSMDGEGNEGLRRCGQRHASGTREDNAPRCRKRASRREGARDGIGDGG